MIPSDLTQSLQSSLSRISLDYLFLFAVGRRYGLGVLLPVSGLGQLANEYKRFEHEKADRYGCGCSVDVPAMRATSRQREGS